MRTPLLFITIQPDLISYHRQTPPESKTHSRHRMVSHLPNFDYDIICSIASFQLPQFFSLCDYSHNINNSIFMKKKLNSLLFCLSLTIAFFGPSSIIKAQNIPENNLTNDRWEKVFQDSFNQSDEDPPVIPKDGASRGGLCLVSPGLIEVEEKISDTRPTFIWNTRPTFIWQGELRRIEIRPANSEEVLWAEKVQDNQQIIIYNGESLKPGNTYYWRIYDSSASETFPTLRITFRVMDALEREVITQELEKLDTGLKQAKAKPETIALAKVKFLAERNLFSDALSEAFALKNPSTELQNFRSNILQYFCSTSKRNRQ